MARSNYPSNHWKEKTIQCAKCKKAIVVRHPRAKYCKECGIIAKEESTKYKAQMYGRAKTFAEKYPVAYEKMCNEIKVPKQYLIRGEISSRTGNAYIE